MGGRCQLSGGRTPEMHVVWGKAYSGGIHLGICSPGNFFLTKSIAVGEFKYILNSSMKLGGGVLQTQTHTTDQSLVLDRCS